jgi:hypothetical protein
VNRPVTERGRGAARERHPRQDPPPRGPDPQRHLGAMVRVHRALDRIQEAQNELGRACEQLSAIRFGHPTQLRVRKLYDRVHAEWYRTRNLLEDPRIELDRDPTPEELPDAPGGRQ